MYKSSKEKCNCFINGTLNFTDKTIPYVGKVNTFATNLGRT